MPINIPRDLPAKEILEKERIFIMDDVRAFNQEIRPLNIAILNLMPEKEKTETQLLRLLGNSPLQVHITLLHPATHEAKTTSKNHLEQFYKTFKQIKHQKFDGMIITGAPIEHIPFEDVNYWSELTEIMDWCKTNVTSTMHICWELKLGYIIILTLIKDRLTKNVQVCSHILLFKSLLSFCEGLMISFSPLIHAIQMWT